MTEPTEHAPRLSADEALGQVIEADEQIIWSGRPDVDALLAGVRTGRRRLGLSLVTGLALMVLALSLIAPSMGTDLSGLLTQIRTQLGDGGWVFAGIALVFMALGPVLRLAGVDVDGVKRHRRWAESLSYGITDRRILIVEGDTLAYEFEPDDLGPIRLRERTETHGDVEFKEIPHRGGSKRSDTRRHRDRRRIAFKALPDAEQIRTVVERWRDAHKEGAERQVEDFLEEVAGDDGSVPAVPAGSDWGKDAEPGPDAESEAAQLAAETGGSAASRRIDNPRYGFSVRVPEEWEIKVRKRRKPYGRLSLDFERWQSLEETTDWNVLRVEGPYFTYVEIHLDIVSEPVITLQDTLDSTLNKMLAGDVVGTDDTVQWGRFTGFSATRNHVEHGHDQSHMDIDRPALIRSTFLHDGVMQVAIVSIWPKDSDTLRATVGKIAEGMTLAELSDAQLAALPQGSTKPNLAWRLLVLAGRGVRVLFGLLLFALAVWTGYDQNVQLDNATSTWMWSAVAGLMLMLRPLALPFSAFDGFTKAPFFKRLGMTLAISMAVALVLRFVVT